MAIQELEAKDAQAAMQGAPGSVFVDVRTEAEYAAGHPAGSVNVPVMNKGFMGMSPNPDFLAVMTAIAPRNAKVVFSCQSGQRSMRACQMLEQNGWTDLTNVKGGFGGAKDPSGRVVSPGWAGSGLAVEQGAPAGTSYEDQKKKVK